jgi:hypothetical protein
LDWAGVPMVVELFGIDDVETLVTLLAHIRNEMGKD